MAFVQSNSTWPTTAGTSTAVSFGSSVQSGSLLVAAVAWNSASATVTGVTDNHGNSWASLGGPGTGTGTLAGFRIQLFAAANAAAGATTVTPTFSASLTRRGVAIHEYTNMATSSVAEGNAVYTSATGSTVTTGSVTTSNANDIIFSAVVASGAVTSAGSGYTLRESANFGSNGTEDRAVAATGTYTASFVTTGGDNLLAIVALKATAPVGTDPQNTSAPVISGVPAVGELLSCSTGTWTNNPTTFAYQWKRETAVGSGSYAAISGQTLGQYRSVAGDLGLRIECDVTASNTSQYPPFTPLRTINVTTVTQFDAAVAGLLPGDLVVCTGSFSGQRTINKRLADWAVFDLNNATFTGGSRAAGVYVGLYITRASHIRTIGGQFVHPQGDGMRIEIGCDSIDVYEATAHNTGTQGFLIQGNGAANTNINFIRCEGYACGNTAYDPHQIPGTGLHCIYFGGGPDFPSGGTIVDFHAHDQPYGCGIQIGGRVSSLQVTDPLIERITFGQGLNAGGNAFNIWSDPGGTVHNVVIDNPTGSDISGFVVLDNDLLNEPAGSIHMNHARFTNVADGRCATNNPAVVYTDCIP